MISKDREITEDVEYKRRVGWSNWRFTFKVLCDRRIPKRLRERFYKIIFELAMTYEAKYLIEK